MEEEEKEEEEEEEEKVVVPLRTSRVSDAVVLDGRPRSFRSALRYHRPKNIYPCW